MPGSISSAATARRAPAARAVWRSAGPRRWRRAALRLPLAGEGGAGVGRGPARWPHPALPNGRPAGRALHRRHARVCISRPRRAQPRQWQLCARQRARRRGRPGFRAGARALYRGRRIDRHGGQRAHPAGGADRASRHRAALCRSDRDRGRNFVRSGRDGVAGAAQEEHCTRSRCRRRRWRCRPRRRPRGCWPMA